MTGVQLDLLHALCAGRAPGLARSSRRSRRAGPHRPRPRAGPSVSPARSARGRASRTRRVRAALGDRVFRASGAQAEAREPSPSAFACCSIAGDRARGVGIVAARSRTPTGTRSRRSSRGSAFRSRGARLARAARAAASARSSSLLEGGDGCPADRWLDAQARYGRTRGADLRLALHGIGVGRLRDVAETAARRAARRARPSTRCRCAAGSSPRRSRREATRGGRGRAGRARAARRPARARAPQRAARARSTRRSRRAGALRTRLDALRGAPSLGAKLAALRRLLAPRAALAGRRCARRRDRLRRARAARAGARRRVELSFATRRSSSSRARFADAGREPLGGAGGGVALLSVARGARRTFARLFVIGLYRDLFPRLVREDPLLPDVLRRALETVLPDVPIKRRGYDEERYLFAAALLAAPAVTLSWQTLERRRQGAAVSPLVEALLGRPRRRGRARRRCGRARHAARPPTSTRSAPAIARRAASGASRLSRSSLAAAARRAAPARAARRCRVRDSTGGLARADLGPFFGFVGAAAAGRSAPADALGHRARGPRRAAAGRRSSPRAPASSRRPMRSTGCRRVDRRSSATSCTRCSRRWSAMRAVPVGVALDGGARAAAGARRLARARGAGARSCAAPPSAWRARRASCCAASRVHLDRRARPFLERVARARLGRRRGPARVLGAELEGSVELARPAARRVRSASARIAATADGGRCVLTDYKTGAPITDAKEPDKRRQAPLEADRAGPPPPGARLRARSNEPGALGRYLFAQPDLDDANGRVEIAHRRRRPARRRASTSRGAIPARRLRARRLRRRGCWANAHGQAAALRALRRRRGRVLFRARAARAAARGAGSRRTHEAEPQRRARGGARCARRCCCAWRRRRERGGGQRATPRARAPRADASSTRRSLLEAGAGTGKTAVLVARVVAWCLGPGWERAEARLARAARGARAPDADDARARAARRRRDHLHRGGRRPRWQRRIARGASKTCGAGRAAGRRARRGAARRPRCARRARAALRLALDQLARATPSTPSACACWPRTRSRRACTRASRSTRDGAPAAARGARGARGAAAATRSARPDAPRSARSRRRRHRAARARGGARHAARPTGVRPADLASDPLRAGARRRASRAQLDDALARCSQSSGARLAERRRRAREQVAAAAGALATRAAPRRASAHGATRSMRCARGAARRAGGRRRPEARFAKSAKGEFAAKGRGRARRGRGGAGRSARTRCAPLLATSRRSISPSLDAAAPRARARCCVDVHERLRRRGVARLRRRCCAARATCSRDTRRCARCVRGEIDQLLVDEFQDTDALQCEILGALALEGRRGARPGLFLVGDPKQSIYGWRNADLAAYEELPSRASPRRAAASSRWS